MPSKIHLLCRAFVSSKVLMWNYIAALARCCSWYCKCLVNVSVVTKPWRPGILAQVQDRRLMLGQIEICADILCARIHIHTYNVLIAIFQANWKIALLSYKSLLTNQPPCLRNLLHIYQTLHCHHPTVKYYFLHYLLQYPFLQFFCSYHLVRITCH